MAEHDAKAKSAMKDLLFGSISGSVGKLLEFPFDTIKVRLQSQPHGETDRYHGTLDCIKKTFHKEGLSGFYRGIASPIVGAAAETSSLFFSYNIAQDIVKERILSDTKSDLSLSWLVACGAASGLVTSYVLTPIELIKCKLQVEHVYSNKSSSILKLCKEILLKDGLKGFWFGQTGTMLRECGGSASWFGVYEFSTHILKANRLGPNYASKDANTTAEMLVSGGAAGIMYNLSLFPADTIKSKMQTNSVINPNEKLTFASTIEIIYKHHGIKGFYRGLGITLIRAVPSNAVIFFTYEKLKEYYS